MDIAECPQAESPLPRQFSCDSIKHTLKSIAKMSLCTGSKSYNWLLSRRCGAFIIYVAIQARARIAKACIFRACILKPVYFEPVYFEPVYFEPVS